LRPQKTVPNQGEACQKLFDTIFKLFINNQPKVTFMKFTRLLSLLLVLQTAATAQTGFIIKANGRLPFGLG
jgi:hypothetical protein